MPFAFKQPMVKIQYGDLTTIAPLIDIQHALEELKALHEPKRALTLQSVNNALVSALPSMTTGTCAEEVAAAFCTDCAIWFANEVLVGRAQL